MRNNNTCTANQASPRGKGERNGMQRKTKVSHNTSIGATAAVGEKARSDVEQ